jgi:predicted amidohydrolase YtcJ
MTSNGSADAVLLGGRVLTMGAAGPLRGGLATRDGRIVRVAADAELRRLIGPATDVVELDGRTVVPGFIDVHTHLAGNARDPRNVEGRDFFDSGVQSVEELLRRVADADRSLPDGEWVVAVLSPLQGDRLREGRLPTRPELDAAVPGRPAYVTVGPHLLQANTRALDAVGFDSTTPDPPGGVIERDPDGRPTGLVRETAQRPFKERRPGARAGLADRLLAELERCARRGVTQVHEIVKSPEEVRAFQSLARSGRLPVRVRLVPRIFQAEFATWALEGLGLLPGFGGDRLCIGGVKISVDGGSSAGQAAFYPDEQGPPGRDDHSVLRMSQDEVDEVVLRYHRAGVQVLVHAVGDLALDMALSSFDKALAAEPRADHRHRIEHMGNYGLDDERLSRARGLGLVAVPNPSSLRYLSATTTDRYGVQRLGRQYPFAWMAEQGLAFALASDGGGLWPVDPLRDISSCLTRTSRDGAVLDGDQALSLETALSGYTTRAAWAGFGEHDFGALEPGKHADLAVLASDPRDATPDDVANIEIDLTWLGGRPTYATTTYRTD